MAKNSHNYGVFISHAWEEASDKVVDALTIRFKQKQIPFIIDKSHLDYRGSIQDFMLQLGKAEWVIIILSNKYLRSEFCMFELIQIYKNERLTDRIYPIVLDEVNISKSTERIELVRYWEDQIEQLQSKLKELHSLSHIEGITEDLNLYTEIRNNIAKLTSILKDINALNLRMHSENDFEILCQSIQSKMLLATTKEGQKPFINILPSVNTSKQLLQWAGLSLIAIFFLLGIGKIIFGSDFKPKTSQLVKETSAPAVSADSFNGRIKAYLNSGNIYSPDKDCAWKSYRQLERMYPNYENIVALKQGLVLQLIYQAENLLNADLPFDAQLLVHKVRELDPGNSQIQNLFDRVAKGKDKMSEIPSLVYTPGNKSSAQGKPDILVQNSKTTDPKLILRNTPSTVDIVDEKKFNKTESGSVLPPERKLKTLTIPLNAEITVAAVEEFSSDGNLQINNLYYFKVVKPFMINGLAAIELNDKVELKFTRIKRSEYKRAGILEFVISKLILSDGSTINLKSSSFLLKAPQDNPLIISKGQQFKVKTAQSLSIEK
ncbi:MAG: toll/interleukin-1 receptor domain-containing protein [Saprospiraceae bacterium]